MVFIKLNVCLNAEIHLIWLQKIEKRLWIKRLIPWYTSLSIQSSWEALHNLDSGIHNQVLDSKKESELSPPDGTSQVYRANKKLKNLQITYDSLQQSWRNASNCEISSYVTLCLFSLCSHSYLLILTMLKINASTLHRSESGMRQHTSASKRRNESHPWNDSCLNSKSIAENFGLGITSTLNEHSRASKEGTESAE